MNASDAKRLQAKLGVAADGVFGRYSYAALFRKCGANLPRALELGMAAAVHFPRFAIDNTPLRLAHFMAQVGHESMGFRYMEEIASGADYEGRKDLGNNEAGDGKRFKGRGPIQLTGRANYIEFGNAIGINLVDNPQIVAIPSIGLLVGCLYWSRKDLNALADDDRVEAITRKINGGLNGFDDRKARLAKAKELML